MSKTFRADQTGEKKRRPQSKKSKRGFIKNRNRNYLVEIEEIDLIKERV
jgi:hypothetical protein